VCVLLAACGQAPWTARQDADIAVLTAPELQEALASGRLSAERVTAAFVRRIDSIDPALNAIIEVNPDALTIARRLDEAFASPSCSKPTSIPVTRW
jgi:amidase